MSNLWDRILRRSPVVTDASAPAPTPDVAADRPLYVVDYKDMRVVPTDDLIKLRDENAWSSATWGYRVFRPDEVFHDEVDAWKSVRLSMMDRRRFLRRSWQGVMDSVHAFRQHRKQFKPNLPYPNRFYLFDQNTHQIITVHSDQMEAVKEYIGEIRDYRVVIAGTDLGVFPKARFFDSFERCAKDSAGNYYKTMLLLLRDNLKNVNDYLYSADARYVVHTSYGTLYARNRKQLRKQLIRSTESGWLVNSVVEISTGENIPVGWKPVFLPKRINTVSVT